VRQKLAIATAVPPVVQVNAGFIDHQVNGHTAGSFLGEDMANPAGNVAIIESVVGHVDVMLGSKQRRL